MHKSLFQKTEDVKLILLSNNNGDKKKCCLIRDEHFYPGELFFYAKTNEILKCEKIGTSGVFAEEDKGFFPFISCYKVIATHEQIGWMWDNHPDDAEDTYLVPFISDEDDSMIEYVITEYNGKCKIEVETICPHYGGSHIGKDCSCKSGFVDVPKLNENKVIIHI